MNFDGRVGPLYRKARKLFRDPSRFFADMVQNYTVEVVRDQGARTLEDSDLARVEGTINRALVDYKVTVIPDKMSARYLRRFGFKAETVVDVGVSRGSDFLYETLPDANHILVDPLPGFEEVVRQRFGDRYQFEFHQVALGAEEGTSVLRLQSDNLSKSTLQKGTRLEGQNTFKEVEVRVQTLDQLLENRLGAKPIGLKLDTEGHELEVLRGAKHTLRSCEFVLAEVSIKRRYENGYRFSEIIRYMAENRFELIDVLNPIGRVHRFFDCLFVPASSPLFSDRSI